MPKPPARSAKEERKRLLDVVHAPDDPAVAPAYAGWLDGFGDATAELIRLRLDRAGLDANDPRRAEIDPRGLTASHSRHGEPFVHGPDVVGQSRRHCRAAGLPTFRLVSD